MSSNNTKNYNVYRAEEIDEALKNNCIPAILFEYEPDSKLSLIPGTDGFRISNTGNTIKDKNGNYIDPYYNENNAKTISIVDDNGKHRNMRVMTAVAKTYVDGYDEKHNIAMTKGFKHDTNYYNIVWGTQSELNKKTNESGKNSPPRKEDIKRYAIIDNNGNNVAEVTGLNSLAEMIKYQKNSKCLSKEIKTGKATVENENSRYKKCKIVVVD